MMYLPDSNILINALNDKRGHKQLLANLAAQGHQIACCTITVAEVISGIRPGDVDTVKAFLLSLYWRSCTRSMAMRAGQLRYTWARKGVTLALADALIAATALEYGLTLITDNAKHFPMPDLSLYTVT